MFKMWFRNPRDWGKKETWNSYSKEQKNSIKEKYIPGKAKKTVDSTNKTNNTDTSEEIRKFKALLDDGIITIEEFETKKKQLLEM